MSLETLSKHERTYISIIILLLVSIIMSVFLFTEWYVASPYLDILAPGVEQ